MGETVPREAAIVTRIIKRLNTVPGCWVHKTHGNARSAGQPDIVGCLRGRFFGLEVKRPGRPHPVSPLQKAVMQKMANAGALVAVVESVQDVEEWLGL